MDSRSQLRNRIDDNVETLAAHVRELELVARDVRHQVRDSVSLKHQVDRHPWTAMGLAAMAGAALARVVGWIRPQSVRGS